jgi:hypothetical protein
MISSTNYSIEEQINTYEEEVLNAYNSVGIPDFRLDVKLPLNMTNFLISEGSRSTHFTNYYSAADIKEAQPDVATIEPVEKKDFITKQDMYYLNTYDNIEYWYSFKTHEVFDYSLIENDFTHNLRPYDDSTMQPWKLWILDMQKMLGLYHDDLCKSVTGRF